MSWADSEDADRRTSGDFYTGGAYPGDAYPGWGWGVVLVPAAVGLAALGLFLMRSLGSAVGVLIGVALVAWAMSLAMPFFVIAWYAVQAAWKAPRERSGRVFAAPSRERRGIGFHIRWSPGARGLIFSPASYGGRNLPMLVAGQAVHYAAIGILILAGIVAALVGVASR